MSPEETNFDKFIKELLEKPKQDNWVTKIANEVEKSKTHTQTPISSVKKSFIHRRRQIMINDLIWNKLILESERLDIPTSELVRLIIIQYFDRK